jgi:hypothetical protein
MEDGRLGMVAIDEVGKRVRADMTGTATPVLYRD